jgi:hypothetical protein
MKKKICINTKISRFITTVFPKQSRHLIIQAELLIEKDKRTNHYNDYLLFSPLFLFLTQIEPFLPTSFLMPIIKEREREKRWLAISAISDLKLAKKENISLRNLAFYYTKKAILTGLTNTYNAL